MKAIFAVLRLVLAFALIAVDAASAQSATPVPAGEVVPVTAENFVRAETDRYFGNIVKNHGIGNLKHARELTALDKQLVIRQNRDTLYSSGIFDLDAGPVTITLPDAGGRYRSLQAINEDHYTISVVHKAGSYTFTRDKVGTRYLMIAIRTLVDPAHPKDLEQVHALQDAIRVEQKSPGTFAVPAWDQAGLKKVRDALAVLGTTMTDSKHTFGTKEQVTPLRHLIGAAIAWGGNPETEAMYLNVTPPQNDGNTVYRLVVNDVPVDGFWSINVYNANGFFEPNPQNAYSLNNLTAKKGEDGSVTVQFGGCDGTVPNCLPITPGWNYIVRLYQPRAEILDGKWTFPKPEPVR